MKKTSKRAFSLVELIIVIVIIAILSGAAYVGIQKAKSKSMNDKVLDDLIAITNSLEQFKRDHLGEYPMPVPGGNMNMNCFYADASYAHDCSSAAFIQGMIDNDLLTKRYLQEVPTDPRTDSRYVYGVSLDKKYFQVAGLYEQSDGTWIAKSIDNLGKGYHLPSLIRAYNGPNFVVDGGTNLPYSPDHMTLTATLENVNGSVTVDGEGKSNGAVVYPGDTITTGDPGSVDLFFSDGSVSHLSKNGELEILTDSEIEENDSDNIITKIKIKLFSGKIWNKVARLASKSEFNVQTTSAIAGVRGTEFGVDGDTEDILVYSGEVCLDGTKICSDPIVVVVGGDPITEMDTGDETTNPDLDDLMNERTMRYLNGNIRPHILQISGAEITVQNIDDFYGLPEGEHITADKIVAYSEEYNAGDAPLGGIEDYELYVSSSYMGTEIVLRFEDTANNLVSGFTMPITITTSTQLTEDDLYVVMEEEEEEAPPGDCQIILDYPIGTFYTAPTSLNWHTIPEGCVTAGFMVTGAGQGGLYATTNTTRPLTTPITYGTYTWEVEDAFDSTLHETAIFTYSDSTAECTPGEESTSTDITTISYGTCTKTTVCTPGGEWPTLPSTCTSITCNIEYELSSGTCVPCTIPKPSNSHYISGCDWGCDAGYEEIEITSSVSECHAVCGDGYIVGGEECDDGGLCFDGTDLTTSCTSDSDCLAGSWCELQSGDGCDALCQWEPIVEIDGFEAGKPYYATSTNIQLIHNGFDAGFNLSTHTTITPSSGADISGSNFIASEPGEYELYASYGSDSYTLNITVCGYVFDGSECWVLGDELQNCDDACSTKVSLVCNDDPPLWEDTGSAICMEMTDVVATPAGGAEDYIPSSLYIKSTSQFTQCKFNNAPTISTVCDAIPLNDTSYYHARICKCIAP